MEIIVEKKTPLKQYLCVYGLISLFLTTNKALPSCGVRATSLQNNGEAQAGAELPKPHFSKQAGIEMC